MFSQVFEVDDNPCLPLLDECEVEDVTRNDFFIEDLGNSKSNYLFSHERKQDYLNSYNHISDNNRSTLNKVNSFIIGDDYARIYIGAKVIKKYRVIVDSFRVRSKRYRAYFLTHFHGDHYEGLDSQWDLGPVYGTATTITLIEAKLGVKRQFLKPLNYEVRTEIKEVPGLYVTVFNANHCAGSAMFYFETPDNETHLFTGDFRYDTNSSICNKWIDHLQKNVTCLHLDASFSVNSGRGHMKQLSPIGKIFHELKSFIKDGMSPKALAIFPEPISLSNATTLRDLNVNPDKSLFIVSTCVPGRERLVGVLAQFLSVNNVNAIFGWRQKALQEGLKEYGHKNIEVKEYNPYIELVPSSKILVLPSRRLDLALQMYKVLSSSEYNPFECVIHIRSTGWDHQEPIKIISAIPHGHPTSVHVSISYTEHSDLNETQAFIRDLQPSYLRCVSTESATDEKQIIDKYLSKYLENKNNKTITSNGASKHLAYQDILDVDEGMKQDCGISRKKEPLEEEVEDDDGR